MKNTCLVPKHDVRLLGVNTSIVYFWMIDLAWKLAAIVRLRTEKYCLWKQQ